MAHLVWCGALAACALFPVATAVAQVRIPLCAGLTMVGSVSEPEGDYEPLVTVTGIDEAGVHLQYYTEVKIAAGSIRKVNVRRTVRPQDLESAALLMNWFNPRAPVVIPGTTAIGTSRAVLRALKGTGTAELGLFDRENSAFPAERGTHPNVYDYQVAYPLRRVTDGPATLPVIVNGETVSLPVIVARGKNLGDEVEFVFLDDDANPLQLELRMRTGGTGTDAARTRTIKLSYQCRPSDRGPQAASPASRLEESLLKTGRAEVYDIYFDFNSDRIREQSEPTLREIADLMARHPEWRLTIEGHTDNIASDQFNLELSTRRAQAVKAALTGRYAIAEPRLTSSGAGESRPKDRNDTPEGRARNRRVELVRLP